jgi:hypothetical protein
VVIVEIYILFLINFLSKTNINRRHQTLEINMQTAALQTAQAGLYLLLIKVEHLNLNYQQQTCLLLTAVTPRTDEFRTHHKRVTSSKNHNTNRTEGTDKQRSLLLWMSDVTVSTCWSERRGL